MDRGPVRMQQVDRVGLGVRTVATEVRFSDIGVGTACTSRIYELPCCVAISNFRTSRAFTVSQCLLGTRRIVDILLAIKTAVQLPSKGIIARICMTYVCCGVVVQWLHETKLFHTEAPLRGLVLQFRAYAKCDAWILGERIFRILL